MRATSAARSLALAIAHGYSVVISNSRGPETLAPLVRELGPRRGRRRLVDAATAGDLVVVTIPLKNYRTVPVAPLAGKIVIDTNNYYPATRRSHPGARQRVDHDRRAAAGPPAHVEGGQGLQPHPGGPTDNRRPGAGNAKSARPGHRGRRRADAKKTVADLLDQFGFDTVDAGALKEGWRIQRDTPGYGPRRTAEELRKISPPPSAPAAV